MGHPQSSFFFGPSQSENGSGAATEAYLYSEFMINYIFDSLIDHLVYYMSEGFLIVMEVDAFRCLVSSNTPVNS